MVVGNGNSSHFEPYNKRISQPYLYVPKQYNVPERRIFIYCSVFCCMCQPSIYSVGVHSAMLAFFFVVITGCTDDFVIATHI